MYVYVCAYLQIQACLQSIVEMPVADRLKAADLWNEASLKLQQMLNEDSTSTSAAAAAASIKSEENIEKEVRERKIRISVSLLFIIITGNPRIVLFFWEKKKPFYEKSVLFGDYFSTKTSEMGEIVFQSPLFEAFLFSKAHFSGIPIFILVFIAMFKVFLDRSM